MNAYYDYFREIGYLSKSQLSGLKNYKYSAVDTNPVGTYLMHPFWNYLIRYFPKWLAPNLITFIGFLFIILSFSLLTFYDYNFLAASNNAPNYSPIPPWVFAVISFSIFTAYTLDGIDGKQARRTNTSGPIGELFDHGLDSWTTVFIPLLIYSLFGRLDFSLPPIRLYYICWAVFFNFYLSHVEKYNTGTLYLPWSYDFSMLGSVILFFVTYLYGTDIWKVTLFNSVYVSQVAEVIFYVSSIVFNIPMINRCYSSYISGKCQARTLSSTLRPLIPILIFFVISLIWAHYSPTNIVDRDPRVFSLITGNIFSNICCELILAQMTHTKCKIFNALIVPFTLATIISIVLPQAELLTLYVMFVVSLYLHITFGVKVIKQLCGYFKILCFRIEYQRN